MHLSKIIKLSSEYHPLEYLLTLPPMSRIIGKSEDGEIFEIKGKKGLYEYDLTLKEMIKKIPIKKYKFEIEFEQEEQEDIIDQAIRIRKIYERTKNSELLKELNKLEKEIAKDARKSYLYAQGLKKRFLLGESTIATETDISFNYANNILHDRFPLGEPEIAKDSDFAYYYAKDIIKGRFLLAESKIMKDPDLVILYIENIIKGRWKEAEPEMAKSLQVWSRYETVLHNLKHK